MILANDNTTIVEVGNTIYCSDGKTYILSGMTLADSSGIVGYNVGSIDEAVAMVVGMHGGRRF